jgi:hypothetical protein
MSWRKSCLLAKCLADGDDYSTATNSYDSPRDLPCRGSLSLSSAIRVQKRKVSSPLALAGNLPSPSGQDHAVCWNCNGIRLQSLQVTWRRFRVDDRLCCTPLDKGSPSKQSMKRVPRLQDQSTRVCLPRAAGLYRMTDRDDCWVDELMR